MVTPTWLEAIADACADGVLVGGRLDFVTLNARNWPIIVDQEQLEVHLGYRGAAPGSNLAIARDAFDELGGFTETYTYGEDVDFSWRAQSAGYKLVYAPDAVIAWRAKPTLRTLLSQVHKVGKVDACLYREYRSRGLQRGADPAPRQDHGMAHPQLGSRLQEPSNTRPLVGMDRIPRRAALR